MNPFQDPQWNSLTNSQKGFYCKHGDFTIEVEEEEQEQRNMNKSKNR